ncbi:MAG: hypothetical protein Kow0037_28250 [Calditrichia bacterium]
MKNLFRINLYIFITALSFYSPSFATEVQLHLTQGVNSYYYDNTNYFIKTPFFNREPKSKEIALIYTSLWDLNGNFDFAGRNIDFRVSYDVWLPGVTDEPYLLRNRLFLREAHIRIPLREHLYLLIGKKRSEVGRLEPMAGQDYGLPLLAHNGNLWATYPQIRLGYDHDRLKISLASMRFAGSFHNAVEYLKREYKYGWNRDGELAGQFAARYRFYQDMQLGVSAHYGYITIKDAPDDVHDSFVYLFEWYLPYKRWLFKGDIFRSESNQMFLGSAGYLSQVVEHAGYGGWGELSFRADIFTLYAGFGTDRIKTRDLLKPGDYDYSVTLFLGAEVPLTNHLEFSSVYQHTRVRYTGAWDEHQWQMLFRLAWREEVSLLK